MPVYLNGNIFKHCKLANFSHSFNLVPPRWIVEPVDQSVILDNSIDIVCQANGFPVPTISWKQAIGW